mgnify:CR=1 FL=1
MGTYIAYNIGKLVTYIIGNFGHLSMGGDQFVGGLFLEKISKN